MDDAVEATSNETAGKPVAGLVLGLFGLILWIIPLLGLPVTITGLVYSLNALKREKKGMAVVGVILNGLGLVATILNALWGAYLGVTGQHPIVNKMFGK
jgi:hypothetical protein